MSNSVNRLLHKTFTEIVFFIYVFLYFCICKTPEYFNLSIQDLGPNTKRVCALTVAFNKRISYCITFMQMFSVKY